MAKGAPDYSKLVLLQALDSSGNLIPVLLDSTGKIISILQGVDSASVLRTLKVDTNGQLIAVIKGSGGENITVDANGFLGALMKGNDNGTLRTMAVDPNGQILARIYDPANVWGNLTTIGLAELATRIQAPISLDKRGEIVWYDDFEASTLRWNVVQGGAASANAIDATRSFTGEQCAKLTVGAVTGSYVNLKRGGWYLGSKRIGLQASISSDTATNGLDLIIGWQMWDGSTLYEPKLKYHFWDGGVTAEDHSSGWSSVGVSGQFPFWWHNWETFKLVVDLSTGKYVRAIMAGTEYDISGYTIPHSASSVSKRNYAILEASLTANATLPCYIDDVIITVNE